MGVPPNHPFDLIGFSITIQPLGSPHGISLVICSVFFPSEGTIDGNPHIRIHHIDHSTMNRYCRSCANIVHHIYFHYESLSPYFWNPMAESHMSYGFILGAIYHVFHRIG